MPFSIYTQTFSTFADVASRVPLAAGDLEVLRSPSVIVDTTGALMLLIGTLVLAVYNPRGLTRHGQRLAASPASRSDPVKRNNRTKVDTAITPSAHGSRSAIVFYGVDQGGPGAAEHNEQHQPRRRSSSPSAQPGSGSS